MTASLDLADDDREVVRLFLARTPMSALVRTAATNLLAGTTTDVDRGVLRTVIERSGVRLPKTCEAISRMLDGAK